jgi:BASS family bile acid:Na+ symporter
MEDGIIAKVLLPLALGIIMLGLGLSLTLDDFKRVARVPKAVLVGLACQMLLLPAACFGIAHLFALPPELAVGLMLLAASPGGATANLFSHLAHGDVALNITLTAVNSILSLFTLPFIVNFALEQFMGAGKAIPLQLGKVMQVFAIVLIPVAIGMLLRARRRDFALRMERPVRILSAVFLAAIVLTAVIGQLDELAASFAAVGLAALTFNVVSMAVGYGVPMLVKLPEPQAIAIGMEIGIHNGTLAIALALSPQILNNATMSIPPAIYSLIMFFTATAFGWWASRHVRARAAAVARE